MGVSCVSTAIHRYAINRHPFIEALTLLLAFLLGFFDRQIGCHWLDCFSLDLFFYFSHLGGFYGRLLVSPYVSQIGCKAESGL
jgi:hypothetical protein